VWSIGNKAPYASAGGPRLVVDPQGNAIIGGSFGYTADFGCGTLTAPPLENGTLFIAKYDPGGSCQWVETYALTPGSDASFNAGASETGLAADVGRPSLAPEIVALVVQMTRENPLWSRRRIAAELAKLGYDASKDTVARYMPKRSGVMVPTVTFNVLYVFFALSLERRRILHVNVTAHPYAA
jgi:hypothetical protein